MNAAWASDLLSQFDLPPHDYTCEPIRSGHIHDSFWVKAGEETKFILQRINHTVFSRIHLLQSNWEQMISHLPFQLILSRQNQVFLQWKDQYWRLFTAIPQSESFEVLPHESYTYEAARLFGEFWLGMEEISVDQIQPVIPRFQDLGWRREQLRAAFDEAEALAQKQAIPWIAKAEKLWQHLQPLIGNIQSGDLPLRIVHNDAKLSNVLFKKGSPLGLAVIDLDTVMPGQVLYDFGDLVRSLCCPVAEDSRELEKITGDVQRFEALASGYLDACGHALTKAEKESLAVAGTYMSCLTGMRFLTDYLQGNVYYKTAYPDHNLHRCQNQFTLALDLQKREDQFYQLIS